MYSISRKNHTSMKNHHGIKTKVKKSCWYEKRTTNYNGMKMYLSGMKNSNWYEKIIMV